MGRTRGTRQAAGPTGRRQSKLQKRISFIMRGIPAERDALLTAMEAFGGDFDLDALVAAGSSPDPAQRLKVAALERELELLVNWLHELAELGLAEGQRLGTVKKSKGHPWERLAELGVISPRSRDALESIRNTRNVLGHAYPAAPRALHSAVESLMRELDPYTVVYEEWATTTGILPPSESRA